jgi:hypothetical protein
MNNELPEVVLFGSTKVVINGDWDIEPKYNKYLFGLMVKNNANKSDKHYAATLQSKDGSNHKFGQFALFDYESVIDSTISGELVVANNLTKWLGHAPDCITIFIRSIGELSGTNTRYWVCGIDSRGQIETNSKLIVNDRFELQKLIDIYVITSEKVNVISVEDDGATKKFITEDSHSMDDLNLVYITGEMFLSSFDESLTEQCRILRVYKPSKVSLKALAIITTAGAIMATSWLAYSYISQSASLDFFSNNIFFEKTRQDNGSSQTIAEDLRTKKHWDYDSYRNETLSQFVTSLGQNLYSPMDISIIIKEINKSLPTYSADWKLSSLNYVNNKFFARYDRIPHGKGVYFLLDKNINQLNNVIHNFDIKPYDLVDEGDGRIFSITPKIKIEKVGRLDKMLNSLRQEGKLRVALAKTNADHLANTSHLLSIKDAYDALSFKDKWVSRTGDDLLSEALEVTEEISNIKAEYDQLHLSLGGLDKLNIERNLVLGNVMDFVTMLQMDSFFDWSYPVLKRVYPDSEMLSSRNIIQNANSPKQRELYGPAIESYEVKITTRQNEEEGKILTYGISDMIHLGQVIDKPFVNVDEVHYDKITEQWSFVIHFHRHTPEFSKRIETTLKQGRDL